MHDTTDPAPDMTADQAEPLLTPVQARVLGCLMEKKETTPDQYPLTLNALRNACNQKSAREPVMNLSPGEVQHTVRALEMQHLLRVEENFNSRVEKSQIIHIGPGHPQPSSSASWASRRSRQARRAWRIYFSTLETETCISSAIAE